MIEDKNKLYQDFYEGDDSFKETFPTFEAFDSYAQDPNKINKVKGIFKLKSSESASDGGLKKKDAEGSTFQFQFPGFKFKDQGDQTLPVKKKKDRKTFVDVEPVYPVAYTDDPIEAALTYSRAKDNLSVSQRTEAYADLPRQIAQGVVSSPSLALNAINNTIDFMLGEFWSPDMQRGSIPEIELQRDLGSSMVNMIYEGDAEAVRLLEPEAAKAAMLFFQNSDVFSIEEDYRTEVEVGKDWTESEKLKSGTVIKPFSQLVEGSIYDETSGVQVLKPGAKEYFNQFVKERSSAVGEGYEPDWNKINSYSKKVFKETFLSQAGLSNYYKDKYGIDNPKDLTDDQIENDPFYESMRNSLRDAVSDAIYTQELESEINNTLRETYRDDALIQEIGLGAFEKATTDKIIAFSEAFKQQKTEQFKAQAQGVLLPYFNVVDAKNKGFLILQDAFLSKYGWDKESEQFLNPAEYTKEQFEADKQKLVVYTEEAIKITAEEQKKALSAFEELSVRFSEDASTEFRNAVSRLDFGKYDASVLTGIVEIAAENVRLKNLDFDKQAVINNSFARNIWTQFQSGIGDLYRGFAEGMRIYGDPGAVINVDMQNFFSSLADLSDYTNSSFIPEFSEDTPGIGKFASAVYNIARMAPTQVTGLLAMATKNPYLATVVGFATDTAMEMGSVYDQVLEMTGSRAQAQEMVYGKLKDQYKILGTYLIEANIFLPSSFGRISSWKDVLTVGAARLGADFLFERGQEMLQESATTAAIKINILGEDPEEVKAKGIDILTKAEQKKIALELIPMTVAGGMGSTTLDATRQLSAEKKLQRAIKVLDNLGFSNFINSAVNDLGLEGALNLGMHMHLNNQLSAKQLEDFNVAVKRIAEFSKVAGSIAQDNKEAEHAIVGLFYEKYNLQKELEGVETEEAKAQIKDNIKAIEAEIENIKNGNMGDYAVLKSTRNNRILAVLSNSKLKSLIGGKDGVSLVGAITNYDIEISTEDNSVNKLIDDTRVASRDLNNAVSEKTPALVQRLNDFVKENLAKREKGEDNLTDEEVEQYRAQEFNKLLLEEINNLSQNNEYISNTLKANRDIAENQNLENLIELSEENKSVLDQAIVDPNLSKKSKLLLNQAKEVASLIGKIYPGAKIMLAKTTKDYNSIPNVPIGSDGAYDPNTGNIYIDLENATEFTIWHEFTHAALEKVFGENYDLFQDFKTSLLDILDEKTRKRLEEFTSRYTAETEQQEAYRQKGLQISQYEAEKRANRTKAEEFLAQLGAFMRVEGKNLKLSTIEKIKNLIFRMLDKVGVPGVKERIRAYYDNKRIVDFMNSLGKASTVEGAKSFVNLVQNSDAIFNNPDVSIESIENGDNTVATPIMTQRGGTRASRKPAIHQFFNRSNVKINPVSSELPVKTLNEAIKEHNGAVIVLTTDTTGFGYNEDGEWRWGGIGNMSITDNINNNIVFGTTEERVVNTIYNNAAASNNGQPVLALLMTQSPDATFGNDWGTKFFADVVRTAHMQGKKGVVESMYDFILNNKNVLSSFATKEQNKILKNANKLYSDTDKSIVFEALKEKANVLIEDIKKIDLNASKENVNNAFLDLFAAKSFTFRKNLIAATIPAEWANRPTSKYALRQFAYDNGMGKQAFHTLYSEPQLTTLEQLQNNQWGNVIGGFTIDPSKESLISEVQDKGITHPFFKVKVPGSSPFLLDAVYNVNENFTEALMPVQDMAKVTISGMAAQSLLPSTREYATKNDQTSLQRREKLLDRANNDKFIKNKDWKASLASFEFADQMFDLFVDNFGYEKIYRSKEEQKALKVRPIDRGVKIVGKQIIIDEGQSIGRSESYQQINRMMVENWLTNDEAAFNKYRNKIAEIVGYPPASIEPMSMVRLALFDITGGSVSTPNYKNASVSSNRNEIRSKLGEEMFNDFSNFYLGKEVEMAGGIHRVSALLYKKLNNEAYADEEYEVAPADSIKHFRASYSNLSTYDLGELIRNNVSDKSVERLNKASLSREDIHNKILVDLKNKFPEYKMITRSDVSQIEPTRNIDSISENEFFINDQEKYIVIPETATLPEQLHFFAQFTLLNIQRFNVALWSELLKTARRTPSLNNLYTEVLAESKASPEGSVELREKAMSLISDMAKIMADTALNIADETESGNGKFLVDMISNNIQQKAQVEFETLGSSMKLEDLAWTLINPMTELGDFKKVEMTGQARAQISEYDDLLSVFKTSSEFLKKGGTVEFDETSGSFTLKPVVNAAAVALKNRFLSESNTRIAQQLEEINDFLNNNNLSFLEAHHFANEVLYEVRNMLMFSHPNEMSLELQEIWADEENSSVYATRAYPFDAFVDNFREGAQRIVREIRSLTTDAFDNQRNAPGFTVDSRLMMQALQSSIFRTFPNTSGDAVYLMLQFIAEATEKLMNSGRGYSIPLIPSIENFGGVQLQDLTAKEKELELAINRSFNRKDGNKFFFQYKDVSGNYKAIQVASAEEGINAIIQNVESAKKILLTNPRRGTGRIGNLKIEIKEPYTYVDQFGRSIDQQPYEDDVKVSGNVTMSGDMIDMSFYSSKFGYSSAPQQEGPYRNQTPAKAGAMLMNLYSNFKLKAISFTPVADLTPEQRASGKYAGDSSDFRRRLYTMTGRKLQGEFYDETQQGRDMVPINPVFNSRILFTKLYDTIPQTTTPLGLKSEPGKPFKASRMRGQGFSKFDPQIKQFVEDARANNVPDLETFSVLFKKYGYENMRMSSYGTDFLNEYDNFMYEESQKGLLSITLNSTKRFQGIKNFLDKYLGEIPMIDLVNMLRNGVEFLEDDQLNIDTGEVMIMVDPDQAIFTPERVRKGKEYKFYDFEIFKALHDYGVDSGTLSSIFGADLRKTIQRAIDDNNLSTNIMDGLEEDSRSLKVARSIDELREISRTFDGINPNIIVNSISDMLSNMQLEENAQGLIDQILKSREDYQSLTSSIEKALAESAMQEDIMAISKLATISGRILRLMRQLSEKPEELIFKHADRIGFVIPPKLKQEIMNTARTKKEADEYLKEATRNFMRDPHDENFKKMEEARIRKDEADFEFARITNNPAMNIRYWSDVMNKVTTMNMLSNNTVALSAVSVAEILTRTFNIPRILAAKLADKYFAVNNKKMGPYTVESRQGLMDTWRTVIDAFKMTEEQSRKEMGRALVTGLNTSTPLTDNMPPNVNLMKDAWNSVQIAYAYLNKVAQKMKGKDYDDLTDVEIAEIFETPLVQTGEGLKMADGREYTIAAAVFRGIINAPWWGQAEIMSRIMTLGLDKAGMNLLTMQSMLDYVSLQQNNNYSVMPPTLLGLVNQKAQQNRPIDEKNMARFLQSMYSTGALTNNPFDKESVVAMLFADNAVTKGLSSFRRNLRRGGKVFGVQVKGMEERYLETMRYKHGKEEASTLRKLGAHTGLHTLQLMNFALTSIIPFAKVPSNIAWLLLTRGNPIGLSAWIVATRRNLKNKFDEIGKKYQIEMPSIDDFAEGKAIIVLDPKRIAEVKEGKKDARSLIVYNKKRAQRAGNYTKAIKVEEDMLELYEARRKYTDAVGATASVTTLYTLGYIVAISGAVKGQDDPDQFAINSETGRMDAEFNLTFFKEFMMSGMAPTEENATKFIAQRGGWKPTDKTMQLINFGTYFPYTVGIVKNLLDVKNKYDIQDNFDDMTKYYSASTLFGNSVRTMFKMTPSISLLEEILKVVDTKSGTKDFGKDIDDIFGTVLSASMASFTPSLMGKPESVSEGKVIQPGNLIDVDKEIMSFPPNVKSFYLAWQRMSRNGILFPGSLRSPFYKSKIGLFGEDLSIRKTISEPGTGSAYYESMVNFMSLRTEPLNPVTGVQDSALLAGFLKGNETAVNQMSLELDKFTEVQTFVSSLSFMGEVYFRLKQDPSVVGQIINRKVSNRFIITDAAENELTGKEQNAPISLPNDILRDEARIIGNMRYSVIQQYIPQLESAIDMAKSYAEGDFSDQEKKDIIKEFSALFNAINKSLNEAETQYRKEFLADRANIIAKELWMRGVLVQNDKVDELQKLINLGVNPNVFDPALTSSYGKWEPKYTDLGIPVEKEWKTQTIQQ